MEQDSSVILTDNYEDVTLADNYKETVLTDSFDSITFDLITGNKGIGFMQIAFDNIVG